MATARNQPTYDFLTGASPPREQSLRHTLRQSQAVKADAGNEELRAQIHKLQYEVEALKQEREFNTLQHSREVHEIQVKAEADFRRAQAAESSSNITSAKYNVLSREVQEIRDRSTNEKLDLEKRLRSLQECNGSLQEDLEEAQAELSSQERHSNHQYNELETRHNAMQQRSEELQTDFDSKVSALQTAQQKLSQREAENSQLESEVLRLKAQTGDTDTLAVLKRDLTEQVNHIKKLESANKEQMAELKRLRRDYRSVQVVEEEKRTLETKLHVMSDLRKELSEAQLQRQILEDEKKAWSAYLGNEVSPDESLNFSSPEDLARAFVSERLEKASLLEKLGRIQPEIKVKDELIESLEESKSKLQDEMEKLRSSGGGADKKSRLRLERQKNLAAKEVEYLRAQVKMFEAEESEFKPEQVDAQKAARMEQLQDLVDQYREETETLSAELSRTEAQSVPSSPKKRPRDSEDDERIGSLLRKIRSLQDESSTLQNSYALLQKELEVNKSQLSSLQASSRTRILALRSNPTADAEAIKMSTLANLRAENKALLAQLEGSPSEADLVPAASLASARDKIAALEAKIASAEKSALRMRQVFSVKSLEFREAVASILGYKMDFMPNGRVRMTSMYYPSVKGAGGGEGAGGGGEDEDSIVFDGEKGTMKVSGGPKSAFAGEIRELIEFWVEGRKEIPCFLAAMTLEFYDRTTRAAKA